MDQATHAWLALEAYRKIEHFSHSAEGRRRRAEGLSGLLSSCLEDLPEGSWLARALPGNSPQSHYYRFSSDRGEDRTSHILSREALEASLPAGSAVSEYAFGLVPGDWWSKPYRVKEGGGRLPSRIAGLHEALEELLRLGEIAGGNLDGELSLGPRRLGTLFWLLGHYLADAHMPFHCDSRPLASASPIHGDMERAWGEQLPALFHSHSPRRPSREDLLGLPLPQASHFKGLDFGGEVKPLRHHGDPWKEAVYICRSSFAASYALIPPDVAPIDDKDRLVSFHEVLASGFCGEDAFWGLSRAIMVDSVNAIAAFWLDAWRAFAQAVEEGAPRP